MPVILKNQVSLKQLIKYVGSTAYQLGTKKLRKSASVITLMDGTTLSVQAGKHLYSTPREDFAEFTHVEVGFPTFVPPKEWMEYAEDSDNPKDTVYGYIPIKMVLSYINKIGVSK